MMSGREVVVALALGISGCGSSASAGAPASDEGGASPVTTSDAGTPASDDAGGEDEDAEAEAGTTAGTGAPTTYSVSLITLGADCVGTSCPCLPQAFPVDPTGQVACQVFFELAANDTCEAHSLAAVPADVLASITAWQTTAPPGPVCMLPQIPESEWVDGSCATSTDAGAGWCYLTGAAAGSCQQVIDVSPQGAPPSGAVAVLGCGATGSDAGTAASNTTSVGQPCIPSQEGSASFGGFAYREVTLDEDNPACPGSVCLVDHFQGLTSCPYGQDSSGLPTNGGSAGCTVPGTSSPVRPGSTAYGETVEPWCADRLASVAVTCSCRCENVEGRTDDGADYCACPSGTTCTQVVPAIESGDPRAGGYCVPTGAVYDPSNACLSTCDATLNPCY
jgi:hypothetical protein